MTAKELIKELQKYLPGREVKMWPKNSPMPHSITKVELTGEQSPVYLMDEED